MKSFAEFESEFLGALQHERSNLQGLQDATEAQLSAWIEHLFREYLGYIWSDFVRGEGVSIGVKGSKQLFPDLRITILDNGLIFVECKRFGRLQGPKGPDELNAGIGQLTSYIRAHLDQATLKGNRPKTVLGLVTDGIRWHLMGLDRHNEFHNIADWAFLTDDPRLIAQRLWLLAKPALAQPTTALVEFLARRTLAEVLKDNAKWLTKKVNEKLPDGAVSEDLIAKWLRDALSDAAAPSHPAHVESTAAPAPEAIAQLAGQDVPAADDDDEPSAGPSEKAERYGVRKRFWTALLSRARAKTDLHANISPSKYSWIGAGSGVRGLPFTYIVQDKGRVELWIDRGTGKKAENKDLFDRLKSHKEEIEKAFGHALDWQRLDGKQGCRIVFELTHGGYKADESQWPVIHDAMIDAMVRLERALAPHLANLTPQGV